MPDLRQEVITKDGHIKTVVASSEEDLAEGVAAVKTDVQAVSPDLHNPKEPNAIVSPDNKPVEDIPSLVDNSVEPEVLEALEPSPDEEFDTKSATESATKK